MVSKDADAATAGVADALLNTAHLADVAMRTTVKSAQRQLDAGTVKEPSRMAPDLADVMAKFTDKRLDMEGRPTQITGRRSGARLI